VLIARKELIEKEPKIVKDVIRVFFESEAEIETNFEEAAKTTIGKYYKTDMVSLLAAAKAQPPGVDIRDKKEFMFGRAQSMKELNYINKDPDAGFVNFKLLDEVISENPDLYKKVKVKAA
jgi:NitT/TauT family transport system substrate-binding protein